MKRSESHFEARGRMLHLKRVRDNNRAAAAAQFAKEAEAVIKDSKAIGRRPNTPDRAPEPPKPPANTRPRPSIVLCNADLVEEVGTVLFGDPPANTRT